MEIVNRLVGEYDIVVEGFRPGVMTRFGLDYDSLKKVNLAVIYCSITGYGQTGTLSPLSVKFLQKWQEKFSPYT